MATSTSLDPLPGDEAQRVDGRRARAATRTTELHGLRAVKVGNRNRIPYQEFERFWRQTMGDVVELPVDDIRSDLFGDR